MKTAFVLITRNIDDIWIDFLNLLVKNTDLEIYAVIDDPRKETSKAINFEILEYTENDTGNYRNSCHTIAKKVIAWDKAIYHFCEKSDHEAVWFIEDDVFIPSVESLKYLENNYKEYDLVCQKNVVYPDGSEWWGWCKTYNFNQPWCHSMSCAIRVSRALLNSVKKVVHAINNIPFVEILWNTIVAHEGLSIACPKELSTIIWLPKDNHDLDTKENLEKIKNGYFFHPVKDVNYHNKYRLVTDSINL